MLGPQVADEAPQPLHVIDFAPAPVTPPFTSTALLALEDAQRTSPPIAAQPPDVDWRAALEQQLAMLNNVEISFEALDVSQIPSDAWPVVQVPDEEAPLRG